MISINNQHGQTIAYIEKSILFDKGRSKVIGVVIGDCFFGKRDCVIGKLIGEGAFLVNGDQVGMLGNIAGENKHMGSQELFDAWHILMGIKYHTCKWIKPTGHWSKSSLIEHLL